MVCMHDYRMFEPEHFILKCRQVPIYSGRCAAGMKRNYYIITLEVHVLGFSSLQAHALRAGSVWVLSLSGAP